ncbi:MAG: hypothetical protein EP311_01830 [Cytophagales bacterium]|uniref:Uncharacterized protein n=1 Tax=Algoriphagus taiwanensis TaxID=1445656 RepID=A0ABQ6Q1P3_9BACT|nr:MAG: hypothetical protein EP311_01830 [Cytophagales bacterium]GMQ34093.1 hypothetical protein Ataiwa_23650 [Algoriphagus taiwanensis]
MRILFSILVILHGLIHLLGWLKGFGLREIKELTLPISKPLAAIWLFSALLLLVYAALYLVQSKYSWIFGILAALVSQVLILIFWKDAKIGTIPNILIFLVSLMAWGQHRFQQVVKQESSEIYRKSIQGEAPLVEEKQLEKLPGPVKNWLKQSGMMGKPFHKGAKVTQSAEMKMNPDQEKWMKASAWQYTSIDPPAFIWTVDAQMNAFLGFKGKDRFKDGKGQMLIRLNSLIPIVDETGEKMDEGSIQRFLGEMVWFPSLALSPYIRWEQIDNMSAKATLDYQGTSGSGTFFFNEEGDVIRFSALRYRGNEPDAQRREWIMDIQEYSTFEGIRVPSKMTSTWRLGSGDWTWLKLEVNDIKYNPERMEF